MIFYCNVYSCEHLCGRQSLRKVSLILEENLNSLELGLKKGAILSQDTFDEVERCSKECLAIRQKKNRQTQKHRILQHLDLRRTKGLCYTIHVFEDDMVAFVLKWCTM